MPGPGHKKKTKTKNPASNSASPSSSSPKPFSAEPYVGEIDNAEGWSVIADILCHVFEVPDLNTRSGLKKVHANFDAIYRKLEKASTQYADNIKIVGGIVTIYAKMCCDALLRNKLWEKGLLKKLLPLLEDDLTRHMALRALGTITHHGGVSIRQEIALHSPLLTTLLSTYPDDSSLCELIISIFSHSLPSILDAPIPPSKATLKKLDIRSILIKTTEVVRKEWASSWLIHHAVFLLAMSTLHASEDCLAYPPMQRLLVSCLRSKDIVTRCISLGGLIRLHRSQSESDIRQLDPNVLIQSVSRGFKGHLQDAMMDYGLPRCDTYLTLSTTRDYQAAMMGVVQDKNLYGLGLKLASFIPKTEFSIADGMFLGEDPRTGKREPMDVGLPFTRWVDALPHCSRAIRAKGKKGEEEDLADIIDIKYFIMKQRIPDAVSLAQKSLLRNPDQAYFYYAITLSANRIEGLKAAKKGLKAKQITPFLRYQMLQRAVEHAGDLGITMLQESPSPSSSSPGKSGGGKWEEGIAFLMSAWEDAKVYVKEAPPDNRHRNGVIYFLVLLTLVIRGEEVGEGLGELKDIIKAQQLADDFLLAIQINPPKTEMRLTSQLVLKLYTPSVREFSSVLSKLSSSSPSSSSDDLTTLSAFPTRKKAEDDLARWLDEAHIHDHHHHGDDHHHHYGEGGGGGGGENDGGLYGLHPRVNLNQVELYRCSYCGNPSAVLRKCSGCSKTRYCDASCQKAGWKEHKRSCGKS